MILHCQTKEKLFDSVYVIEPYDHSFLSNAELAIPLTEFNNDGSNVNVVQFEPKNGVYLKLPNTVDTTSRMLKVQANTAGVFVFIEKPATVSLLINTFNYVCYLLFKSIQTTWIAGAVIPIVLVLIIVISTIVYFKLSPARYSKVKDEISKTKRSFFSRV